MPSQLVLSKNMSNYFEKLSNQNSRCYDIAEKARKQGKDPENFVEIPRAEDLASRVEKLLFEYQVEGIADDIRKMTEEYGNREVVALMIARKVSKRPAESMEKAVDRAVRVGLAVLTEGILVAPLEGIASTKIKMNEDGTNYIDLVFAGPIRAAGGTGQAMSVLIADVVRQELGIGKYIPTSKEIARFDEEIPLYKQCQHLQFSPSPEEIELIVKNCPVCIDGEGTEEIEISGYRDLPRIETNRVRGGACLVLAEGMCQKASKLKKHVDNLKIEGWDFIGEFVDLHVDKEDHGNVQVVEPSFNYLKDIVAGRPIFGHPCKVGGFRLRYGRARTSGLAALAFSPASMYAMDEFMALGTQVKIERPGKACVVTPCDILDGPTVLLNNGDLIYCQTKEEYIEIKKDVVEVIDNGEILIPFGEFCENNHVLVPCGYPIEWHKEEILSRGELPEDWENPSYERAKEMCKVLNVPLHPNYNIFWYDVSVKSLKELISHVESTGLIIDGKLTLELEPLTKRILEDLCAVHKVVDNRVIIDEKYSLPIIDCLGLSIDNGKITIHKIFDGLDSLSAISDAAGYEVRAKARTRIGTRMARPEKAKEREMTPKTHVLFPVGKVMRGGKDIDSAIKTSKLIGSHLGSKTEPTIKIDAGKRMCPSCSVITFRSLCRDCDCHTTRLEVKRNYRSDVSLMSINIEKEYKDALTYLNEKPPSEIKCMDMLTSKNRTPEALEKGILRAKHGITMFRDGTIRFDMTDIPLTHFRPDEIGLTVEKAHELGYTHDWNGDPLTLGNQLCELKVQDVVPPKECGNFFVKVAQYVDDELEKLYHLEKYYNVNSRNDLIGQLAFGLAPHTSGCILCRIIGYSGVRGCYGHPFYHASKRRNCDGDEDCLILAMDGLLNFSRSFLPDRRGGLMDAPLVLTTRLDPNEIDKEAHNIDCLRKYPLEFYQAAMNMKSFKEVESIMDLISGRIGTEKQYEEIGFTHDTSNISEGPKFTSYSTLETMMDKMEAQLYLGKKIRAVDERDVATKVINKHFLPDMAGNLRSFAAQTVRCTKCGEKYRRIPLSGICNVCRNNLVLTVHEASVKKYLKVSKEISEKYKLDLYTIERIEVLNMSMDSLFNNDKVKQCKLTDFY